MLIVFHKHLKWKSLPIITIFIVAQVCGKQFIQLLCVVSNPTQISQAFRVPRGVYIVTLRAKPEGDYLLKKITSLSP